MKFGQMPAPSEPSSASSRLWTVIALSLPTIVGTGFFLAGAVALRLDVFRGAPPVSFEEPSGLQRLESAVEFAVFLACYCGAAFGPCLLPLAAWQALGITREAGVRSRNAVWAWTFVVLGLVSTALFWGWLIDLDLFI